MTRYRLYLVLTGMFVIGVSAVMTPMVGTTYALTAEEMLADPALETVRALYPNSYAVLSVRINLSMTVMLTLPRIYAVRYAPSLSKAKLMRRF